MVQAHQSCSKELEGRARYVNAPSSPKEKAGPASFAGGGGRRKQSVTRRAQPICCLTSLGGERKREREGGGGGRLRKGSSPAPANPLGDF